MTMTANCCGDLDGVFIFLSLSDMISPLCSLRMYKSTPIGSAYKVLGQRHFVLATNNI